MTKYRCYVCRKEHVLDGDSITGLGEDEVLLCPSCAEVVQRLTGQAGREVDVDCK